MSDESDLAKTVTGDTLSTLAKAPVWLAAGIIGVPSLIAIGAGYFIVHGVAGTLQANQVRTTEAMQVLHEIRIEVKNDHQEEIREWVIVRGFMSERLRMELRNCLHMASDERERNDCLKSNREDFESLGRVQTQNTPSTAPPHP